MLYHNDIKVNYANRNYTSIFVKTCLVTREILSPSFSLRLWSFICKAIQIVISHRSHSRNTHEEYSHPLSQNYMQILHLSLKSSKILMQYIDCGLKIIGRTEEKISQILNRNLLSGCLIIKVKRRRLNYKYTEAKNSLHQHFLNHVQRAVQPRHHWLEEHKILM
jgi:hypothetical protein